MKLTVEERPDLEEAEVTIRCPAIDRRVRAIMATANAVDCRLLGTDGTGTFIVEPSEVLYAETVDGRTFLYGRDRVCTAFSQMYQNNPGDFPADTKEEIGRASCRERVLRLV